ncbi:MAG: hypothetical protein IKW30_01175 [Lachnospiraceae bacterium]|nr:hypothetical protein [Lachnospiraceae bacterium]
MTGRMEYLTDAELENMLCDIEQNDMVQAPPDMQERILETLKCELHKSQSLEAMEQEPFIQKTTEQLISKQDKIIAYKRYRFRVMTTVAAAVMVVFLLPRLENLQQPQVDFPKLLQKQEELIQSKYATREEILNRKGMLETVLGDVNIFADNSKWNLFR